MKFEIPKVVRLLKVAEYAAEFGDAVFHVWVNPPSRLLEPLVGKDVAEEDRALALAELWSQGPEGTQMTPEDIQALINGTFDTDPALFSFLVGRTLRMVAEHRKQIKKA